MPSDAKTKTPLTLGRGKLELKKTVESGQVRQSFSHGRSKVVQVERKRKRQFEMGADGKVQEVKAPSANLKERASEFLAQAAALQHGSLTEDEKAHRLKALQDAMKADEESRRVAEIDAKRQAEEDAAAAAAEKLNPRDTTTAEVTAAPPAAGAAEAPAGAPAAPRVPGRVVELRPGTTPAAPAAPAPGVRRVDR